MKILAANRLIDGGAVWLGEDGLWVDDIRQAHIARDREAELRLLEIACLAVQRNEVVDAECVDIEIVGDVVRPLRLRERIRATGPSIYPELSKSSPKTSASLT